MSEAHAASPLLGLLCIACIPLGFVALIFGAAGPLNVWFIGVLLSLWGASQRDSRRNTFVTTLRLNGALMVFGLLLIAYVGQLTLH